MSAAKTPPPPDVPFVNEMRLNPRHWVLVVVLFALGVLLIPRLWSRLERFETNQDYRIPYTLSRDYWLYERRLRQIQDPASPVLIGDSVIWGEYVAPDGTLSHFLNEQLKPSHSFVNAGVNGLFPLAMEGLTDHYTGPLHGRKILLHCNFLWMSSPKADLQTKKEEKFNHSRLTPQFSPKIPCYKADANERLSVIMERHSSFLSWVSHLQSCYFNDRSIPKWTLMDDGNDPPHYPNARRNPLREITLRVPEDPSPDPQRGKTSPRHKAWNASGNSPTTFEWVDPSTSLQWAAFQRTVEKLRARHNQVLVVAGPFNEHIINPESKAPYDKIKQEALAWLKQQGIPTVSPKTLPSELYADASHPLTDGYSLLAQELASLPEFKDWLR